MDDCTADCTTSDGKPELSGEDPGTLLTIDPQLIPGAEGAILRNENNYTDEYLAYLNLGTAEPPKPDLPQLQFELSLIAEETGEPPAIVYVSFVPGDLDGGLNGEPGGAGTPISQTKAADDIQPTDVLEIVVVTPDGPPILKTLSVQHTQVFKTVDRFRTNVTNRSRVRTRAYLSAAQELNSWLIDPIEAELTNRGITSLAFVMPPGLRSLPVSALHDGEQFLIERYSVGLMPSVSLTDMRYVDVRETEVLAMGASDFEDQPELPAVPIELSTIAEELWPGDFVINETFTPDSLVASRARKPYGIVHLATHAEFVSGQPEESFILLGDGDRVSLRDMSTWSLRNVDLVVLSACQTGLGGTLGNGEEILGFGYQIQRAGAKSAIASLWSVDDGGTQALMTTFYDNLRQGQGKGNALRQAQIALITEDRQVLEANQRGFTQEFRGPLPNLPNTYSHPYYWSSFILIGNSL